MIIDTKTIRDLIIDTKTIRDLHAKRGDHPWGSSFEHVAYQHMPELLDAYDRLAEVEAELASLRTDRDGAAEACQMLQEDKARLEQDNARLQAELAQVREALETLRVILLGRSADYEAMNYMIKEHSVPLSPFTHGPAQVRLGLEIIEDRLVALSQPAELDLSGAIRVMDKMANSISGGDQ